MRSTLVLGLLLLAALASTAGAQQATITPQVRSKATADNKITEIELEAHFVTTIRVPEPVNSVVVGDPALFQVEHSEHEPELVFVKALISEPAESNLLISRGNELATTAEIFRTYDRLSAGHNPVISAMLSRYQDLARSECQTFPRSTRSSLFQLPW